MRCVCVCCWLLNRETRGTGGAEQNQFVPGLQYQRVNNKLIFCNIRKRNKNALSKCFAYSSRYIFVSSAHIVANFSIVAWWCTRVCEYSIHEKEKWPIQLYSIFSIRIGRASSENSRCARSCDDLLWSPVSRLQTFYYPAIAERLLSWTVVNRFPIGAIRQGIGEYITCWHCNLALYHVNNVIITRIIPIDKHICDTIHITMIV